MLWRKKAKVPAVEGDTPDADEKKKFGLFTRMKLFFKWRDGVKVA